MRLVLGSSQGLLWDTIGSGWLRIAICRHLLCCSCRVVGARWKTPIAPNRAPSLAPALLAGTQASHIESTRCNASSVQAAQILSYPRLLLNRCVVACLGAKSDLAWRTDGCIHLTNHRSSGVVTLFLSTLLAFLLQLSLFLANKTAKDGEQRREREGLANR